MYNRTLLRYTFFLLILFLFACSAPEKPVTKEEAAKVAALITDAMARRDSKSFTKLLDPEAFEKRIMKQSNNKVSRLTVREVVARIMSGEFADQVIKALNEEGTYELVKQYEKDKHQHLLFRMYNEQVNYHDYELIKKGNQVKIADAFNYFSGENLSYTMGQTLQSLNEQAALINKLNDREFKKINVIRKFITEKKFQEAGDLYKTLPAIIRNEKVYKLLYIQIASGLESDVYLDALNKFRKEYPDATNIYLLSVDAFFMKEDYENALQCINSLDSLIDKDHFLDYYRALSYKSMEDLPNQLACLERLHKKLPAFNNGMLELINAYLEDHQYDKAVLLTTEYRKRKFARHGTLEALYELYPAFKEKMEAVAGQ